MSDALFWHLSDVFALSDRNVSNGYRCTKSRRRQGGVFGYPPLTSVGRDLKTFTLMGLVVECFPFSFHLCLLPNVTPTPTPVRGDPGLALFWFIAAVFVTCHPIKNFSSLPVPHIDHKLHNQASKYIWFTPAFSAPGMCSEHSCHSISTERMNAWMHLALCLASVPLQPWFWASPYKHRISQQQQCKYWGPGHWGVGCFVHL